MHTSKEVYNLEIFCHHYGYMIEPDEIAVEYFITNKGVSSPYWQVFWDFLEITPANLPNEVKTLVQNMIKVSCNIGNLNIETSIDLPANIAENILQKEYAYENWPTLNSIFYQSAWNFMEIPWYNKNAILWGKEFHLKEFAEHQDVLQSFFKNGAEINFHTKAVFDQYRVIKCQDILAENLENVKFRYEPNFILELNGNS